MMMHVLLRIFCAISITRMTFGACGVEPDDSGHVVIPSNWTAIEEQAFARCASLTNLSIPETITKIGASAFAGCSGLISVVVPDSVLYIGRNAFHDCKNLESITIGKGVVHMGVNVFCMTCPKMQYIKVHSKHVFSRLNRPTKYDLFLRGETFRRNKHEGDREVASSAVNQLKALRSMRRYVIDEWAKWGYALDNVYGETYTTTAKFQEALHDGLVKLHPRGQKPELNFQEKLDNSTQHSTVKSFFARNLKTRNLLVLRFDLLFQREMPLPLPRGILWEGYHAPQTAKDSQERGRHVADTVLYIPEPQYANARKFFMVKWPLHEGCLAAPEHLHLRCSVFEHIAVQSDPLKKILPNAAAQTSADRLYIFAGRGVFNVTTGTL